MTRRQHRLFGHLAFVAMLLLALVPSLGRLLAPAGGARAHAGHAMAGMAGTPPPATMPAGHVVHDAAPPIHPPAHLHDTDCAYCALLGSTMPTVAAVPALPVLRLPPVVPALRAAPPRRGLPPGGPGSRGPPPAA